MALLHVPFEAGINDNVDPVGLDGKLYQAENVRIRKQFRIEKRYGLEPETFVVQGGSGAYATRPYGLTGLPNVLGSYKGAPFLAADYNLGILASDTAQGVTGTTRSTVVMPTRLPVVLPGAAFDIAMDPVSGLQHSMCKHGDNLLAAWGDAIGGGYTVFSPDGTILKQQRLPAPLDKAGIRRIVALSFSGHTKILALPGDGVLYGVGVSQISHEMIRILGGAVQEDVYPFATAVAVGMKTFDACAADAVASCYVASGAGTTTASIIKFSYFAFGNEAATSWTAAGVPGAMSISVADGTRIYVAYTANPLAYNVAFNLDLTTKYPAGVDNALSITGHVPIASSQIGVGTYPGAAIATWGGTDTAYASDLTRNSRVGRVAVVEALFNTGPEPRTNPERQFWHLTPASHPFQMGSRYYAWFATANDLPAVGLVQAVTGWQSQRTHWMMELTDRDGLIWPDTASLMPVMSAAPLVASNSLGATGMGLGRPVSMGDGRWYCDLPRVYRRNAANTADEEVLSIVSWTDSYSASVASGPTNLANARRSYAEAGGAAHFAGGAIYEYNGALEELNFVHYPVIISAQRATGAGGGGWATGQSFSYTAAYEWLDPQGRRHRSAPADPVTVGLGVSDAAQIYVTRLAAGKARVPSGAVFGDVFPTIYRTQNGGDVYFRATDLVPTGVAAAGTGPTSLYTDRLDDVTLSRNEVLYTQGGVLGNIAPPGARYVTSGGGRVWLGGLLRTRRVQCSKLIVDGEPVQFADDDAFRVELPEDVTGIKWADGVLIAFSENSIYLVAGDGPNDEGQGSFSVPQRLPSDVGTIDHHSIVEHQDGWMFRSKRGIHLLPRGFGPPVFVGGPIQGTLLQYPTVRSAAVVSNPGGGAIGETTVRYIVSDANGTTRVPVWDTALKAWVSVDEYESNDLALIGNHDDRAVVVRDDMAKPNPIRRELTTAWGDGSQATGFVSSRIRTGNIRPFGFLGWGRVNKMEVMGELREPAALYAKVSYDGATGVPLDPVQKVGAVGQKFWQQYHLTKSQCNSIDVELWDGASGAGQGLVFHGLTLDVTEEPGLPRRGGDERS